MDNQDIMDSENELVIVVPAYNPDSALIALVESLCHKENVIAIVVVDDGSQDSEPFDKIKANSKVKILAHDVNMGKGRALKTAFNYITNIENNFSIVTADADGQHLVEDIISTGMLIEPVNCCVLGSRDFSGDIPLRSKLGNKITRLVFFLSSGKSLVDTQTGLRGFSKDLIPSLLAVTGEKYEYETNILINLVKSKTNLVENKIETIYYEDNKSSNFRPLLDSFLIYMVFLRYSMVAFSSFLIDILLFAVIMRLTDSVYFSTYLARIGSGGYNYFSNRAFTFKHKASVSISATKYLILAFFIATLSAILTDMVKTILGIEVIVAKVVTDIFLFTVSFVLSKVWVFRR